jgi:hypothetical protein
MSILNVIILSLVAGAGGWLAGYTHFSKTQSANVGGNKEDRTAIVFSGVISILVGLSLFLVSRIVASPDAWFVMGLLVIISLSGALGGVIGFFYRSLKPSPNDQPRSVLISIVMGIGAALLVPLLLHILTSNLLGDIKQSLEKAFILSGLCLAAAISSEVFIERIIGQFNDMANTGKNKS